MTYHLGDEAAAISAPAGRQAGGGRGAPAAALDISTLFREQHVNLVRLAALLVGDLPTAEDVVQDFFAKLHTRRDRIAVEGDLLAYARTCVVNGFRSVQRRRALARRLGSGRDPYQGLPAPLRRARGQAEQVVVAPDGKTAYVLSAGPPSVTPVNLVTGRAGRPVGGFNDPAGIAITPNGKTVYVLNSDPGFVFPFNTATDTLGGGIKVADWGADIAITPDGRTIYVSSQLESNVVTPISTATNTAGRPVHVTDAAQLVLTPDGSTLYVASGSPAGSGTVTPVSTATSTVGQPVSVGAGGPGASLAVAPDGRTVYAAGSFSTTLTPIDVVTGRPGRSIRILDRPGNIGGIVIAPDGGTAWVMGVIAARPSGWLVRVGLATATAGKPADVGYQPAGLNFSRDGRTVYVATDGENVDDGFLIPVNAATGTTGAPIPLPGRPWSTSATP